ncbi:hypothetical protein M0Q50_10395 [bacterium]|jgi:hypothetical protein|nr:hypothetical protein [bacterium]
MKIGDKLFCKKTINDDIIKDNYYIIDDIWVEHNMVIIIDPISNFHCAVSNNEYNSTYKYIWEHFYTPEEIRTLKLESL